MRKSNIAVVMMALMVSIPFCTSIAFASLTNPTVTGSENIAGYIKRQDSATFSFDAEEGDIAGADVHFVNERDGPLFQCAWNIDGRYTCSYTTDSNNLPDGAFSRNALVVRSDEVVDQIAIPGVKDIAGPRIPVLSVTPETIGSGNIKVDYRIEDQVTAGDTTRCIGIKDLTLKIGDFVQTIPINTEANHCVYESSITKSIGDVTSMIEGFLPIEARAVDRFDQKSAVATATVTVNRGKPVIMENTFRLFDSRNRDIQYIKSGTEAFAEIEIQDNDLVSARADFSALSSHNGVSDASCSEGVCKWDRVTITETGSREVTITARDALGNSDTKTFSVVIQADDTSPVIQGLHSNRMDSAGVSYLGKKNNILSAEIDESDVGIDRNSIHLDLSSVGKGSAVAPTNCSRSDNMWTCYWNIGDINIADGIKRISMVPGSTDNLGNSIDGVLKYDFTVDLTPPQITSITSTPQAVTSGDKLTITVQASDSNPIVAIVNLTGISSSGVAQSACDEKCIVEIEDIVPSYTVADVPITVEDAAGNTITKRQRVTVLQANENATPNFFTVSNTQVIPNRIDKQVASQIPVEIFVHVVLSGAGSGRILDKTIDCPDMTDYAASWQLMNDAGNDPYIAIVLNQRAGTMESIPIKCTLKLAVRDDRNIYRRLEEESISASLSVYGNAFGDLTDAAKQKLEAINNEIQETEDDIQNYQQIIDTWGIWCQISEGLGTLNSVLQGIKSVLYLTYSILWVACTAEILPPAILGCQKLNEAAWFGSSCEVFSKYQQFIEFWIWPTGYVGPGIVGMVNKYSCMIGFHCMLCNINELYNVAMDWVMHGIAMSVNTGVTSDGDRIGKGSTVDTPDGEGTVVGFDKSGNALVSQEGNIAKTYDSKNLQIAKKPSAGSGSQGSSQESGPWSPGDADSVTRSTKKTNPKKPDAGWNAGTRPGKDNPNWQYKGEFDARGRATPGAMQQNRKTGDTYVYAMDKNDQTSYKWQQTYDGWEEQGLTTTSTPDPGFLFNPYKSIHFAKACLCLPAIVYNLGKSKRFDAIMRYEVYTAQEKAITVKEETIAVETRASSAVSMNLGGLSAGNYYVRAIADYAGKAARATGTFRIVKQTSEEPDQGETQHCPRCDDNNKCTNDICSADTGYQCRFEKIVPCCGNNACEETESYENCLADCVAPAEKENDAHAGKPIWERIELIGAAAKNDKAKAIELCGQIEQINFRFECYTAVGSNTHDDSMCEKIDDSLAKDVCYKEIAAKTMKSTICAKIVKDSKRDQCYLDFTTKGDYSVCDKITNQYLRQSCESLRDMGQVTG